MSDAMTNPEIEDVVSSIRRLVSEDVRPAARSQEDMQEAGKFVLTPALRVAETAPAQENAQESTPEMHSDDAPHPQEGAAQDEPHSEDEHHEDAHHSEEAPHEKAHQADEAAHQGDHDDAWSAPDHAEPSVSDHPDSDDRHEEQSATDHPATDDHNAKSQNAEQNDTLILEGGERIDEVDEAAPEVTAPSFDAQNEARAEHSDPAAQASAEEGHSEEHAEDRAENHAEDQAEDAPQDWQDEAKPAQSLEDRIADLEAAVGAQSDEWEPDGSEEETSTAPSATILQYSQSGFGGGAAAGLSAAFEDPTFEDPNAEPVQIEGESFDANEFGDDEDDFDDFIASAPGASDDAILDEAALRELVGAIVREELQGALGERITRNVRRLVRREVQRALSLREFE